MCRARPGPRCSHGGRKRYGKAVEHFKAIKQSYDHEKETRSSGEASPRRRKQLSNAARRLDAARRVYYGTPDGQEDLRNRIAGLETELAGVTAPARGTPEADLHSKKTRALATMRTRLSQGISRRQHSYSDLALVRNERTAIRNESRNRGGTMGLRAHPMSRAAVARHMEFAEGPQAVTLREWEDSDVERASSWIESGADPAWQRNGRVRPPRRIGDVTDIGDHVEGETPHSKLVRVNSPDGQVVEARHDFHLTKNSENKYVVSLRSTAASSWEDASPIDKTTQELGHVLKKREIGQADAAQVVGTFSSKAAAKRALSEAKRDFDYAGTTAKMGRSILVRRASRGNASLQSRGIMVWHRYNAEWTRPTV